MELGRSRSVRGGRGPARRSTSSVSVSPSVMPTTRPSRILGLGARGRRGLRSRQGNLRSRSTAAANAPIDPLTWPRCVRPRIVVTNCTSHSSRWRSLGNRDGQPSLGQQASFPGFAFLVNRAEVGEHAEPQPATRASGPHPKLLAGLEARSMKTDADGGGEIARGRGSAVVCPPAGSRVRRRTGTCIRGPPRARSYHRLSRGTCGFRPPRAPRCSRRRARARSRAGGSRHGGEPGPRSAAAQLRSSSISAQKS